MHSSLRIEPLESRIAPAAVTSIDLSTLDGTNGFKFTGTADIDVAGLAVSDAGDVNGDGLGDLLVAAYGESGGGTDRGAIYVIFGTLNGFPASVPLSSIDGTNGFKLNGVGNLDYAGKSVRAAGDVNGDGFGDIVIGARDANEGGDDRGAVYVVFGKDTAFDPVVALSALDGTDGFKLSGVANNDYAGNSVSGAGDVNGDGFDDIIIGAYRADEGGNNRGAAYVVFGRPNGFAPALVLSALDGTNGFKLSGAEDSDLTGASVSAAGDVNGDGFDDMLIGAWGADAGGNDRGTTYVVFGTSNAFPATVALSTLPAANGFKINGVADGDQAGYSVSGVGDVNGDGIDDVLVGAYHADEGGNNRGAAYVVFGNALGFGLSLELSTLDGTNGFKISGVADDDETGAAVSAAGDVNGDGFDDLLIGAAEASDAGAAFVVFGRASGFAPALDLSALDGTDGFRIDGIATGDLAGISVSAAGDVNGDGFGDVLIGAIGANEGGDNRGAAYVVYGFNSGTDITNNAGVLNIAGNGKTATFTDVDGDTITVKITIGTLDANNFTLLQPPGAVVNGAQLARLDLSDPEFQLSGVTITAKRGQLGGDGRVNVGYIDANGVDLGAVNVAGDLGQIDAGDGNALKPAVASLTVQSLGRLGTTTQDLGASLESDFDGKLGKLTVKGGIAGASLDVDGDLGPVSIKSGITSIDATDEGLTLNLNRARPAFIDVSGNIASLTVGAGIFGLFGVNGRGIVAGGSIGAVKISGDIFGSSIAADSIKSLTVAGSMSTGAFVTADGALGAVKISGGLFLGGISGGTIGAVKIGRDLFGSVIAAQGNFNPASNSQALAIKSLTVGGDVAFSQVLAGYQSDLFNPPIAVNGNVQIGKVSVSGDWIASDLVAGIDFGADERFGVGPSGVDDDDVIAGGLVNPIVSQIAGIVIKGQVLGTAGGADHFAFTAEKINSLKVGGTAFPLTTGGTEDLLVGSTNDVRVREI